MCSKTTTMVSRIPFAVVATHIRDHVTLLSRFAASRPRVHKRYCVRFHGDPERRKRNQTAQLTHSAPDSMASIGSRSPSSAHTPTAESTSPRKSGGLADVRAAPTSPLEGVLNVAAANAVLDEVFCSNNPPPQQTSSTQNQDLWQSGFDIESMSPQVLMLDPYLNDLDVFPGFTSTCDVASGMSDGHGLSALDNWKLSDYECGPPKPPFPRDASDFGCVGPELSSPISSDRVVKPSQLAPCLSPYPHGAEFGREKGSWYLQFCGLPLPRSFELPRDIRQADLPNFLIQILRNACQGSHLCGIRLTTPSCRWWYLRRSSLPFYSTPFTPHRQASRHYCPPVKNRTCSRPSGTNTMQ